VTIWQDFWVAALARRDTAPGLARSGGILELDLLGNQAELLNGMFPPTAIPW
jgi:hypothetical protein